MCKNQGKPCPGCKKNTTSEAGLNFFSDDERQALEVLSKAQPPARAATHP